MQSRNWLRSVQSLMTSDLVVWCLIAGARAIAVEHSLSHDSKGGKFRRLDGSVLVRGGRWKAALGLK